MNVYLVWSGSYSDARVNAVFSTEELAKQYCRFHNPAQEDGLRVHCTSPDGREYYQTPEYYVDEWGVDDDQVQMPPGFLPYEVAITKDGSRSEVQIISFDQQQKGNNTIRFLSLPMQQHSVYPVFKNLTGTDFMTTVVLAKSPEHAVKIAAERRAWIIALNRWPDQSKKPYPYNQILSDDVEWPEDPDV